MAIASGSITLLGFSHLEETLLLFFKKCLIFNSNIQSRSTAFQVFGVVMM